MNKKSITKLDRIKKILDLSDISYESFNYKKDWWSGCDVLYSIGPTNGTPVIKLGNDLIYVDKHELIHYYEFSIEEITSTPHFSRVMKIIFQKYSPN